MKHPLGAMLQISWQSYFLKGKNEAPKHGVTRSTGEQRIEPDQSLLLPLPHTWAHGSQSQLAQAQHPFSPLWAPSLTPRDSEASLQRTATRSPDREGLGGSQQLLRLTISLGANIESQKGNEDLALTLILKTSSYKTQTLRNISRQ